MFIDISKQEGQPLWIDRAKVSAVSIREVVIEDKSKPSILGMTGKKIPVEKTVYMVEIVLPGINVSLPFTKKADAETWLKDTIVNP